MEKIIKLFLPKWFIKIVKPYLFSKYGYFARRNLYEDLQILIKNQRPIILDCGAYNGNQTQRLVDNWLHPEISLVEANPELIPNLKKRFKEYKNIHIFENALGIKNGSINFNITKNIVGSSVFSPSEYSYKSQGKQSEIIKSIPVKMCTFDSLFSHYSFIDFVNMDLEGSELEVLKSASKSLPKIKILLVEVQFIKLFENNSLFSEIEIFLRQKGFQFKNFYHSYVNKDNQLTGADALFINTKF